MDLHRRLSSVQAEAAAEALRARVAHFMAQQAAGQVPLGSLGSAQVRSCPALHSLNDVMLSHASVVLLVLNGS